MSTGRSGATTGKADGMGTRITKVRLEDIIRDGRGATIIEDDEDDDAITMRGNDTVGTPELMERLGITAYHDDYPSGGEWDEYEWEDWNSGDLAPEPESTRRTTPMNDEAEPVGYDETWIIDPRRTTIIAIGGERFRPGRITLTALDEGYVAVTAHHEYVGSMDAMQHVIVCPAQRIPVTNALHGPAPAAEVNLIGGDRVVTGGLDDAWLIEQDNRPDTIVLSFSDED